jgi:hypothetical protein
VEAVAHAEDSAHQSCRTASSLKKERSLPASDTYAGIATNDIEPERQVHGGQACQFHACGR